MNTSLMNANIEKLPRKFIPGDFQLTSWEGVEPYFIDLVQRPINSREDLEEWLLDMSEVEAVVSEDACWRQIKMTCDTTDKTLEDAFTFFCTQIQPKLQPYADQLNRKLFDSPFVAEL